MDSGELPPSEAPPPQEADASAAAGGPETSSPAPEPEPVQSGSAGHGEETEIHSAAKQKGLLLLASRSYSSSEDDEQADAIPAAYGMTRLLGETKDEGGEMAFVSRAERDAKSASVAMMALGDAATRTLSAVDAEQKRPAVDEDDEDAVSAASSSAATEDRPKSKQKARASQRRESLEDLDLSVESLKAMAQQRGLDTTALSNWSVRADGKLLDPEKRKYRSVRDALRAYYHSLKGSIPREDMYFLAILRRRLAEHELPLVDGPISVLALGMVVPEDHFYTSKKLFPIGYETLVNVQITKPLTIAFRLICKIVHGNKKKSPIFVVELEKSTEIVFRSYVASKAWKKALVHFESLSADDLVKAIGDAAFTVESDNEGKSVDVLTPASGEDGFGLLRRNITRVLEGLHQVFLCKDYQFWEQRHAITPDAHAKLRSRLKGQVKEYLKAQNALSREEIKRQLSQEAMLEEHAYNPDELVRIKQQRDKEQREADKRSVREAARKLLEIEMKAQEDAKEAQRRAKEERKNAILEAKLEVARQKEARKEAARLAKEEERRMREEEKEMKRALREEEKRKKLEEKENSMKRRIEELRQRRQMREEQKSILENGVMTSSSPRRSGENPRKRRFSSGAPNAQSLRQQQLALLKFVEEEKDRRRQIRVWEKKSEVDRVVWTRVKQDYVRETKTKSLEAVEASAGLNDSGVDTVNADVKFPSQVIRPAAELDAVPSESHADLLFVWDFIATFSDCLKLTVLPSLGIFVNMLSLSDGSSPVGDGALEDDSVGLLLASLHAELLKALITEYFPVLQLGTTMEEFYRTRPMNAFSWPELARQVCQLAMEVKHPSVDERVLKTLKGSKSYRDDSVALPLREKLQRRGTNLLKGVQFQEELAETDVGPQGLIGKSSTTLASDSTAASAASSDYYGVVLVGGVSSKIQVGEKDQHLVVTSISASPSAESSEKKLLEGDPAEPKDGNVEKFRVGDYIVCVNGRNARGMTLESFSMLLSGIPAPHGLLMASVVPVVKIPMKHIPTTVGSSKMKRCGFVLKLLRSKEIAAPFNQPVDAELYSDYYSSGDIPEPMDLGTISEKIEDEDYENDDVESFVDDVALVWKNCYTYNSLKAEISNLARKLSVVFERLMKEWVYTTANRPMVAGEEDNCRNCQTIHVKGRLLLCDRCDAPYHTFCLASPLAAIPKGEWFCPNCLADPSFSPERFRKKAVDVAGGNGESRELNEDELTDSEKRIQAVIGLLSQENYSKLTVGERLMVLRVLCDLLGETAIVQSVFHSLEEKANEARRDLGESLADLEREWEVFAPPRASHGVEQTKKFIIDGVEHELTGELLLYLEEKAKAELESKPVPSLPESAQQKLSRYTGGSKTEPTALLGEDEDVDSLDDSEEDEELILEEFGDQFLLASTTSDEHDTQEDSSDLTLSTCAFCGLEDGILNGPLHPCKRSPLTSLTMLLHSYEVPELLAEEGSDMFVVRRLDVDDLANIVLEATPEGVHYSERSAPPVAVPTEQPKVPVNGEDEEMAPQPHSEVSEEIPEPQSEGAKGIIYAINDRVVFGMSRIVVLDQLRSSAKPVYLYLTSLPGEAIRASVSIVKCHGLEMGVELDSQDSFVFVQSYRSTSEFPLGFGQLCGQVFPGDLLLMVDDAPTQGKKVNEVQALLQLKNPEDSKYVVLVRPPSAKMQQAIGEWQRVVHDVASQRAKESAFRAALISPSLSQQVSYDVTFRDGPLGLALALETRGVVVKSLNDHADGTLGQASLSGRIVRGDLVERVNGAPYGPLGDLSQFTSWLLSLPRPLRITFSRQVTANNNGLALSEQKPHQLEEVLGDPSLLRKQLGLYATSEVKTFRIESLPLPLDAEDFLETLGVITTNGLVYCEANANAKQDDSAMNGELATPIIAVGDRLVGLNGKSIAGLSWASVKEMCTELSSTLPVYLHLSPSVSSVTLLQAHESCVESANLAWSECGHVLPRVEMARKLESFIKWLVIPRTLAFGKCRQGYAFYRFFSDRRRLYVVSPEKKWAVCDSRAQLKQLLAYLEADARDADIAVRIRWCFHLLLHSDVSQLQEANPACCEYSEASFLRDGPFAIEREVLLGISDGDMEKYEALTGYHGRQFFLGSFPTQHGAESALQHAEAAVYATGLHLATAGDVSALRDARFPCSLVAPTLKAESVLKRSFARKYEYGSATDAHGMVKAIPMSHDVYNTLRRGLRLVHVSTNRINPMLEASRSGMHHQGMQPIAMPRMQGGIYPATGYPTSDSRFQDALKRKQAQTEDMYARQAEQLKRSRYGDPNASTRMNPGGTDMRMQQSFAPAANDAVSFKRSLQALVDRGRSMLAAWNQFAASATAQTTNGLAYACLSSFEEVKKAVSRIVVDSNGSHPDPKTFVCLHHAYVMGVICAMATQALTTSRKTPSDSALVKQVADAFATAILNCVDPSNMLRARALGGFAAAVKKCEPSQRPGDLSVELHNVANFLLRFVQLTRYLSGASFEDLSACRPLFSASTLGVETLPASFVQQINLLENVRKQFAHRLNLASTGLNSSRSLPLPAASSPLQVSPYGMAASSTSMAPRVDNSRPARPTRSNNTLVDVEFGFGPLGIVINYSHRGTIIVTEFSNDNGMMGQAQASGKIQVNDEVYAVNGSRLEVIGMEGFKAAVGTSKRPLRVTFRRPTASSSSNPGGAVGMTVGNPSNTTLRQQAQGAASAFGYPTSGAMPGAVTSSPPQPGPFPVPMNQRTPSPNTYEQQPPRVAMANNSGYYSDQQARSGPMTMTNTNNVSVGGQMYPPPASDAFTAMTDNLNPFPFEPTPVSQSMTGLRSSPYGMPQMNPGMNAYMGEMPGPPFPAVPMSGSNYDTLPSLYDDEATGAPGIAASGGWQGAANPMSSYPQGRAMQQRLPGYPPGPTPNGMDVNGGGNMRMPLNPMPLMNEAAPMGYPSVPPPSSGAPNAYQGSNSSAEYVNFVAANDPQLPPSGDAYYDANGTTYRGISDFEVDTSGITLSSAANPSPSTAITADADTEPESPSMSQVTTPAQSDTDGERSEVDRQRDREAQLASLTAVSNALQSSSSTAPAATAVTMIAQSSEGPSSLDPSLSQALSAPAAVDGSSLETPSKTIPDKSVAETEAAVLEGKPPIGQDVDTSGDAAAARRSSRVSRKITTNIADMYDPEFVKLQGRQVGTGSGSEAGLEDATSGEVGELATELLEEFHATIRPLKPDVPRSLLLLRAQLLTMEAAIPRDAFRPGRWGRAIRVAWAEMVYSCASAATLMEAVVFLEFNLEAEWLDPCWKASPLQTAKNALATATIASAAMRLYALDDAITYGRMKRGGKRKHKAPSSASSSRPNSPTRSAIITQEKKAMGPISHPSELPFMRTLSAGVTALANKMIHRILAGQRDRTLTAYASRKLKSELMAITSLTEAQVDQWIQVASSLANHPSMARGGLSVSTSGLPPSSGQSGANGRHATPKRKHPGSQAPAPLAGQRPSSTRKRRAPSPPPSVASPAPMESETQSVKLRCFQMKTPTHRFPNGSGQDTTLRPRLEYIVAILLRNELALAFSAPVNSDDVPGYAELIKHPMDLGTIKTHLSRGLYDQRFELVARDVNLVWENCFTFNRLDADISKCANRLRSIFDRLFEQWITDVPPSTPVSQLASEEQCRRCRQMNGQDSMLLCDSCDAAYHLYCLEPPLAAIPPGNWYCPRCPVQHLSM